MTSTIARIAITGHRPKDLPSDITDKVVAQLTHEIAARAIERFNPQAVQFHTGGALGIDQWVARAAINRGFENFLHLPFTPEVMSAKWRDQEQGHLRWLIANSNDVCAKCQAAEFSMGQYQIRNECMVDAASVVIAFWTGKMHGGTCNCIEYALRAGKPVYNALDSFKPVRLRTSPKPATCGDAVESCHVTPADTRGGET